MNVLKIQLGMALCLFGALSAHAEDANPSMPVAAGGVAHVTIIVAPDAAPSVAHASEELARFLGEITGQSIPIVHTAAEVTTPGTIDIGNCTATLTAPDKPYGNEEYELATVGSTLVIAGGAPRGVLYGVYDLLEETLGCRWFTPTVSRIPKNADLVIPAQHKRVQPRLEYREPFVMDCYDGDWNARNRMNGNRATLEEKHGGKIQYIGFVHTFNALVPVEKHFDEHPEYFALVNGERLKERTQLCCTNPDVVRIVTEGIRAEMRAHPEANVFSVSQNDWFNFCTCETCTALSEAEGTTGAPVFALVNQVAAAVREEFPDKLVDTLAYQWTRRAPKRMRFEPNVVVRLCSIECCFAHPFEDCKSAENRAFVRDTEEWSRMGARLWVWDYTTSFSHYLVPFPNLNVRAPNIKFFADHGVTGIFEQDVYNTLSGEFSGLSGYLGAKLLWSPDYDADLATNEYLNAVYGPAAIYMRQYLDELHAKSANPKTHMDIWVGPEAPHLDDQLLAHADRLFDGAEAAVTGEPEVLERVRVARLSVDYAILERIRNAQGQLFQVDHGAYTVRLDPAFAQRVARFFEVAERNQLTALREQGLDLATYRSNFVFEAARALTPHEPVADIKPQRGINYAYFEGAFTDLPDFGPLTPTRSGVAKGIDLRYGARDKAYAMQFSGYFLAPADGVYTFTTYSNDGSQLFLNEELLVDNGGNHKMEMKSGMAALRAGYYPLRVNYFQAGSAQGLEVYIEGPNLPRQILTAKLLARD